MVLQPGLLHRGKLRVSEAAIAGGPKGLERPAAVRVSTARQGVMVTNDNWVGSLFAAGTRKPRYARTQAATSPILEFAVLLSFMFNRAVYAEVVIA
jgi:hypothetical protein